MWTRPFRMQLVTRVGRSLCEAALPIDGESRLGIRLFGVIML